MICCKYSNLLLLFSAITSPYAFDVTNDNWFNIGSITCASVTCNIQALAVDKAGNLYVGGAFSNAGGIEAANIAKWDGNQWTALGSGLSGSSYCHAASLIVDNENNLYVGGQFTIAGGIPANNIAKWDGSTWSALGTGMNSDVSCLVFDKKGTLWAGGQFTTAGRDSAYHVAQWRENSWIGLITPGILYGLFGRLAVDTSGVPFASYVTTGGAGAIITGHMSKWTPSGWIPFTPFNSLGMIMTGTIPTVSISTLFFDKTGILYAAGGFICPDRMSRNIIQWKDTVGKSYGKGTSGYINALCLDSSGTIFAGGTFDTAGGLAANNIAQWDGNAWHALGSGINGTVVALAIDNAGNLYAGSIFTRAGNKAVTNIALCRYREMAVSRTNRTVLKDPFSISTRLTGIKPYVLLQSKISGQVSICILNLEGKELYRRIGVPILPNNQCLIQPSLFPGKGLYIVSASLASWGDYHGVGAYRITQKVIMQY